jgi:enterochelin esterase-like enzyme
MKTIRHPRLTASLALAAALVATAAAGQEGGAVSAAKARADFARPVVLAPDDVRAVPEPPEGFDRVRANIAHGRVEAFRYESGVTGTQRVANVYLPAGYSTARRYPVLYLLHGIAGNQDEWRGYVHADTILDNLLADGRARPMIVVMPNGRALPDDRPPPASEVFTPAHAAGFERFEADLLRFLVPAIDTRYPTLADARHRAIAGLSMGGGQALNIGLAHLDTFAWVGGFSAAPNTRAPAQLLPDAAAARRQLALLYLSCGSGDGLISVSQGVHRALRQQDITHVWNVDGHGHDRESWAPNFHEFAQRLFR